MIVNIRNVGPDIQNPKLVPQDYLGWLFIGMASDDEGYLCKWDAIDDGKLGAASLVVIDQFELGVQSFEHIYNIVAKVKKNNDIPVLITLESEFMIVRVLQTQSFEWLVKACKELGAKIWLCDPRVKNSAEKLFGEDNILITLNHYCYPVENAKKLASIYQEKKNLIVLPYNIFQAARDSLWASFIADEIGRNLGYQIIMLRCSDLDVHFCDMANLNIICLPTIATDNLIRLLSQSKMVMGFDSGLYGGLGRIAVEAAITKTIFLHSGTQSIANHLYPTSICNFDNGYEICENLLTDDDKQEEIIPFAYHEVDKYSIDSIRSDLKKTLGVEYL